MPLNDAFGVEGGDRHDPGASSASPTSDASVDPLPRGRDLTSRIGQLTRQKGDLERERDEVQRQYAAALDRINAFEGSLSSLHEEIKSLREGQGSKTPTSWSDFSEDQLAQIISDPETRENPAAQTQALLNLVKKSQSQAVKESMDQIKSQQQLDARKNMALREAAQRYGDDVVNERSDLYQIANQTYLGLAKRFGQETIEQMPELQLLCFQAADSHLKADLLQKYQTLLKEHEGLKRRVGVMEDVSDRVSEATTARREALSRGDIKGAIRQLQSIRSLRSSG